MEEESDLRMSVFSPHAVAFKCCQGTASYSMFTIPSCADGDLLASWRYLRLRNTKILQFCDLQSVYFLSPHYPLPVPWFLKDLRGIRPYRGDIWIQRPQFPLPAKWRKKWLSEIDRMRRCGRLRSNQYQNLPSYSQSSLTTTHHWNIQEEGGILLYRV